LYLPISVFMLRGPNLAYDSEQHVSRDSLFHSHHALLSEKLDLACVPPDIVEHRPFCNLF